MVSISVSTEFCLAFALHPPPAVSCFLYCPSPVLGAPPGRGLLCRVGKAIQGDPARGGEAGSGGPPAGLGWRSAVRLGAFKSEVSLGRLRWSQVPKV